MARTRLMFIFLFMVGNLCKDPSKPGSFIQPGLLSHHQLLRDNSPCNGAIHPVMFKAGFPHMPFRKSQNLPFIRQVLGFRYPQKPRRKQGLRVPIEPKQLMIFFWGGGFAGCCYLQEAIHCFQMAPWIPKIAIGMTRSSATLEVQSHTIAGELPLQKPKSSMLPVVMVTWEVVGYSYQLISNISCKIYHIWCMICEVCKINRYPHGAGYCPSTGWRWYCSESRDVCERSINLIATTIKKVLVQSDNSQNQWECEFCETCEKQALAIFALWRTSFGYFCRAVVFWPSMSWYGMVWPPASMTGAIELDHWDLEN